MSNALKSLMSKYPAAAGAVGLGVPFAGLGAFSQRRSAWDADEGVQKGVKDMAREAGIPTHGKKFKDFKDKTHRRSQIAAAVGLGLYGGVQGGIAGHSIGQINGRYSRYSRYSNHGGQSANPSRRDHTSILKDLGIPHTVKTKMEAKTHFRNLARKHHPDLGGDAEKMKKINNDFEDLQKTQWFAKLAFWRGFDGQ